mmetsp:Transcript_54040/g.143858  ORF Transcript_54040/g.143858 Transcript_54040/m.143858 type:complete len:275 (-) Transcript_54040:951-1775(-)
METTPLSTRVMFASAWRRAMDTPVVSPSSAAASTRFNCSSSTTIEHVPPEESVATTRASRVAGSTSDAPWFLRTCTVYPSFSTFATSPSAALASRSSASAAEIPAETKTSGVTGTSAPPWSAGSSVSSSSPSAPAVSMGIGAALASGSCRPSATRCCTSAGGSPTVNVAVPLTSTNRQDRRAATASCWRPPAERRTPCGLDRARTSSSPATSTCHWRQVSTSKAVNTKRTAGSTRSKARSMYKRASPSILATRLPMDEMKTSTSGWDCLTLLET